MTTALVRRRDDVVSVVERAKAEIVKDVLDGFIPIGSIDSLYQLHDHVDANCYGGAFEDDARDLSDVGFWNAVQETIAVWIAAGQLRARVTAQFIGTGMDEWLEEMYCCDCE